MDNTSAYRAWPGAHWAPALATRSLSALIYPTKPRKTSDFCGRHLLLAQLRPANIDGARGARNQIRRIVRMIRERWPNVDILLRGDSGFARENLMRWCEGNAVDYVFGLAGYEVLLK